MEAVIGAWQKAFGRDGIGANENFFELGGDTSLAAALFAEISHALGREVSPLLVLHAPTIASQCAVLQHAGSFALPTVASLKKGDSKLPPILMFHGCGATVLELVNLANCVQVPNSIYGLQNPGSDGMTKPFERIENVAKWHFDAIEQQKIEGPYLLIGYSAGGLVALELAIRLKEIAQSVPLLIMIDSFPPLSALPRYRLLGIKLRREAHRWAVSVKRSGHTAKRGEERADAALGRQPIGESVRRYREAESRSLESYRAHAYHGRVRFVRASASWTFPLDPKRVWSSFLPDLTIESTPGDHTGLMTKNCGDLAILLTGYIDEAVRKLK